MSNLDLARIRQAFPVLRHAVYLNTGTYGLMPAPALEAYLQALAELERSGVAYPGDPPAWVEEARPRIASLLGAEPEEIALTGNTSDGINLVLAGLDWRPGDQVIATNEEHEGCWHPLLYLQARQKLCLRRVEVSPQAETMLARLEAVASPHTRLLAMSHVTCETGTRLPLAEIQRWARSRGILTLFDGAQTLGVMPIDLGALGCDFYTSNGHKWLGGPKGTGIFYARRERLAELKPAHVGADSLAQADPATGTAEPWPTGRRFEFGTRAWPVWRGLVASLDWLEALGWAAIEQHMAATSGYLRAHVLSCPYLRLLTPQPWAHSSALTSLAVRGQRAVDVQTALREKWRIHVRLVTHYDAIRISTAHFNSQEDVDRLLSALDAEYGAR